MKRIIINEIKEHYNYDFVYTREYLYLQDALDYINNLDTKVFDTFKTLRIYKTSLNGWHESDCQCAITLDYNHEVILDCRTIKILLNNGLDFDNLKTSLREIIYNL